MFHPIIDAHIHFDLYKKVEQNLILASLAPFAVDALISVSNNISSAKMNLALAEENKKIKPAFGYHPEQPIPGDTEKAKLMTFIKQHHESMVAVGEVGLPYYFRQDDPSIALEPYVELLEVFIKQAAILGKPIVLHAVYGDAPIVCTLLEKYSIKKAHFHWFKGDDQTIERMIHNNYFISVTPDLLYEEEIQQLVKTYPLSLLMVETDGPWPFEGPFKNKRTHPKMIHQVVREIAWIKEMNKKEVYDVLYKNTKQFYGI